MRVLAILLAGFSVFSAVLIALSYFRRDDFAGQRITQWLGVVLLLVLAGLQLAHFAYLQYASAFIHHPLYRALLFSVAPAFFLFSLPLLHGQSRYRLRQAVHFVPVLLALWLPFNIALPLAFGLGAGYLVWLARSVYALRTQRSRFRLELMILAGVFVIAVGVLVLGLLLPLLDETLFFTLYTCAIGCAFLLVNLALNTTPRLSTEVAEAAQATYAVSTLDNVDCAAALSRLSALMQHERLFEQPDLDLATLAARLSLSNHQLSELINARLGKGFARYIREYRVEAAKNMLLAERTASVLSVGLSVGFASQSTFYDAFRELTGMSPGQYRKINGQTIPE